MSNARRELKVYVQQRGGIDRTELVEGLVRAIVGEILSTRMANTLRITVQMRATTLPRDGKQVTRARVFHAEPTNPSSKHYRLEVDRDCTCAELARFLAHELRHVEQFARGRLRRKPGVDGRFWRAGAGEVVFYPKAQTFAEYMALPWEVEACATEALGTRFIQGTPALATLARRYDRAQSILAR